MQDNFWILGIALAILAAIVILIDHYRQFEDSGLRDGERIDRCPTCDEWVVHGTDYTVDGHSVIHGECWDSMKRGAYPCSPIKFP